MKNGTIPLLSKIGGFKNSIIENDTGYFFDVKWKSEQTPFEAPYELQSTTENLVSAVRNLNRKFRDNPEAVSSMRSRTMTVDNSWRSRVRATIRPLLYFVLADGPKLLQQKSSGAKPRLDFLYLKNGEPYLDPRKTPPSYTCSNAFGI